jgi:DNA-binding transcriptional MerR regulator
MSAREPFNQMASHHPIRKTVVKPAPEIPDKLYFRIGDVARLCEVPAYVLRFWESEFPQLKPNKGGTGQRLYRKRDVEMALRIKSLLYDQGYTIPGARQVFKNEARPQEPVTAAALAATDPILQAIPQAVVAPAESFNPGDLSRDKALNNLRAELRSLATLLGKPVSAAHPPAESKPAEGKLATMRPRLVLEPRPTRPELKPAPRLQLHQRDLFGFDDDGPVAS